jgi:hypothetical protein
MSEDRRAADGDSVIELPPPHEPPGSGAVDDHVATPYPRGIGHQPTEGLDTGVGEEHLSSPSQGVRPEEPATSGRPGEGRGAEETPASDQRR